MSFDDRYKRKGSEYYKKNPCAPTIGYYKWKKEMQKRQAAYFRWLWKNRRKF